MGAFSGLSYAPRLDLLEMPAKGANQQVGKSLIEHASNRKENPAMPVWGSWRGVFGAQLPRHICTPWPASSSLP